MNKEQRMFTLIIKDNETYNDVVKEADKIAKINGFNDYCITANVGAVDIWEMCKEERIC